MKYFNDKSFIYFADQITRLLDNPYLFNSIRSFLTRDQKEMKKFIKKYLEKYRCKSIADICSGTGEFAMLTPVNATYIGLDLNRDYINFARKQYKGEKNKSFMQANVLTSKLIKNKKFDAVLLISTMHHFSDKEMEELLPMVKRIVNKVVIIADIIPNPPHPLQKFFTKIDRGKFVRPEAEKIKILEKYFKIVKTQLISTGSVMQFCVVCETK
jgi:ubiquinone/menaquinone biosynthesis C-methylase UbiE